MSYPNHPNPVQGPRNTMFVTHIRFDASYLQTKGSIIMIILMILNLLGLICIQSSAFSGNGRGIYFMFVGMFGSLFTATMLTLYLFHIVEKYHNIKWLKIEMIICILLVFLNLTAATVVVAFGNTAYSAAGFFSYLAMVAYGYEAFMKVKSLKTGELAQGHLVVAAQTHVVTPPALP